MSTPPEQHPPNQDHEVPDTAERARTALRIRWGLWALAMLGLLGYLAIGSVSVVSYRYSMFMQQTFREVERRSLFDVWAEQVRSLSSSSYQWLMNGAFVAAIVLVVAAMVYGTWLLLVASAEESSSGRLQRRNR